jgi:hypothetical protein
MHRPGPPVRLALSAGAVALALALALVLGGCGGSGGSGGSASSLPAETLAVATPHGLSYTLHVTRKGSEQCTMATYRTSLTDGRPLIQTTSSCGEPALPGHPFLIQAPSSRLSIVVDISTTGCTRVLGGRTGNALQPLVSHCTSRSPQFRATILPAVRRLLLRGIPGAPVINFPRHPCRLGICITALA